MSTDRTHRDHRGFARVTEVLLVSEFPRRKPHCREFGVRVHRGSLTLGPRRYIATDVDGCVTAVEVACEEIKIFENVVVDELDTNHGGRVTFVGADVDQLEVDQTLTSVIDD
jgi:hypothetical protein